MKNKISLFITLMIFMLPFSILKAQDKWAPALFNSGWSFHKGDISAGIKGVDAGTDGMQ
jgi:beta-galactosidase